MALKVSKRTLMKWRKEALRIDKEIEDFSMVTGTELTLKNFTFYVLTLTQILIDGELLKESRKEEKKSESL